MTVKPARKSVFKEVDEYVRRINDELHKHKTLSDMIQRSITENYKRISEYLINQEERFFNALVLAVYDGDPIWKEIKFEYNEQDYFDLGMLILSGDEKIFPIDGQHRVEGIKDALKKNKEIKDEKVPVILIGHRTDKEGMQRARRLFSTLNRYANR